MEGQLQKLFKMNVVNNTKYHSAKEI